MRCHNSCGMCWKQQLMRGGLRWLSAESGAPGTACPGRTLPPDCLVAPALPGLPACPCERRPCDMTQLCQPWQLWLPGGLSIDPCACMLDARRVCRRRRQACLPARRVLRAPLPRSGDCTTDKPLGTLVGWVPPRLALGRQTVARGAGTWSEGAGQPAPWGSALAGRHAQRRCPALPCQLLTGRLGCRP